MRELKIRFISFSVFQFIFENLTEAGRLIIVMDLIRGTRELT